MDDINQLLAPARSRKSSPLSTQLQIKEGSRRHVGELTTTATKWCLTKQLETEVNRLKELIDLISAIGLSEPGGFEEVSRLRGLGLRNTTGLRAR